MLDDLLWNGSYYIQLLDSTTISGRGIRLSPPDRTGMIIPKYQYGDGCLADQLLGQYLAFNAGLGYVVNEQKAAKALLEVYKNNFFQELRQYQNVQRVYGLNDESGLVLCTWPNGNQPVLPFVYAQEVWSGVEYAVAASLIYAGYPTEGIEIVEGIQDRYDGFKRNPFEHDESGVHYARALSSWALLTAFSGMDYDATSGHLGFNPKTDQQNFRTLWTTGTAWGSLEVVNGTISLQVLYGTLALNSFGYGKDPGKQLQISTPSAYKGNKLIFRKTQHLSVGETLVFSSD